jgi:hypothetical protein
MTSTTPTPISGSELSFPTIVLPALPALPALTTVDINASLINTMKTLGYEDAALADQLTGELAYADLVDSGAFVGAPAIVILLAKKALKLNRSFWDDWIEEHLASSANKNAHYWKSK